MPGIKATVDTDNPARLINRLCKHFSHKIEASWNETEGDLTFAMGRCRLEAQSGALSLFCEAEDEQALTQVGEIVASHLERFAGGEVEVHWQPA